MLIVVIAMIVLAPVLVLSWQDSEFHKAVDRIRPGMSEAELRAIQPSDIDIAVGNDKGRTYIYFGIGESATIVLQDAGDGYRVTKVNYDVDDGPFWERFRRRSEQLFRRFKHRLFRR
jgi:hypothetical protein